MRKQQAASSTHAVRQDRDRVCEGRGHRGDLALLVDRGHFQKRTSERIELKRAAGDEVDLELRDLALEQIRREHDVRNPHGQESHRRKRLVGEGEKLFLLRGEVRTTLDPVPAETSAPSAE